MAKTYRGGGEGEEGEVGRVGMQRKKKRKKLFLEKTRACVSTLTVTSPLGRSAGVVEIASW